MGVLALLWAGSPAVAQSAGSGPQRPPEAVQVRSWTAAEGLPNEAVRTLHQTRDGFLWVGTFSGAARFDGARFDVWDSRRLDGLGQGVIFFREEPDGTLWLGTNGRGLHRVGPTGHRHWETGPGRHPRLPGNIVRGVAPAGAPGAWLVFTSTGIGRLEGEQFVPVPAEWGGFTVLSAYDAGDGLAYACTNADGLLEFRDGALVRRFTTADGLPSNQVESMARTHDGDGLLVCTRAGVALLRGGKIEVVVGAEHLPDPVVNAVVNPAPGVYWVGTDGGLVRLRDGRAELFSTANVLPDNLVRALWLDRDDNLWVGTWNRGLLRLRDTLFRNLDARDGLTSPVVNAVVEDGPDVLLATGGGLFRRTPDGRIAPFRADLFAGVRVRDAARTPDGALWVASPAGLHRFAPGDSAVRLYGEADGLPDSQARTLDLAADGTLWVGLRVGVAAVRDGRVAATHTRRDGLTHDFALDVLAARDGALWVGTDGGGANVLRDGRWSALDRSDGLPGSVVYHFHEDPDGTVWIATNGGLAQWRAGRLRVIGVGQGLPLETVFQMVAGPGPEVWLTTPAGVLRTERRALEEVLSGLRAAALFEIYGVNDGLGANQCTAVGRSRFLADGALWIATTNGAAVLDRAAGGGDKAPPRPLVEAVLIDGQPARGWQNGGLLELGPDTLALEIAYTAPELTAPARVRFASQLIGLERGPRETSERSARYTNLDPGDYRFVLRARGESGEWSETVASVRLRVAPHFHETPFFLALCAGLLVLTGLGLSAWRERASRHRAVVLKELVRERTEELRKGKEQIEHQHNQIIDSLTYAQRIQSALIRPGPGSPVTGLDGFVLFQPHDLVSGDYYWVKQTPELVYVVVADCTGHGVPGAFVSLMGTLTLDRLTDGGAVRDPGRLLEELDAEIRRLLGQGGGRAAVQDGMVAGLLRWRWATGELVFAGARLPLFLARPGEPLERVPGTPRAIGGRIVRDLRPFETHEWHPPAGTMAYLATDGYTDQINPYNRRLGTPRLREVLGAHAAGPAEGQRAALVRALQEHQQGAEQLDDITVLGLRLPGPAVPAGRVGR